MTAIVPFESGHLEAAAALLAGRHRAERKESATLPAAFEQPAAALKAIQALWDKPRTAGVAALDGDQLAGYLIGDEVSDVFTERSGWVRPAGHALAPGTSPDLYHALYAALAEQWVGDGCFAHYVMVMAGNRAMLEAWFALGFGKQQAYGICALDKVEAPVATTLDIRQATAADKDAVAAIADNNVRYQTGSPVFAPVPPEYFESLRADYVEAIEEDDSIFWLAFKAGRAVGYQVYYPAETDETDLLYPDGCIELPAAGTVADERGNGIGTAMTRYAFAHAREAGYRYCVADWRTTNPLASRAWTRAGFAPVAYRLERRLDPRIAWGRAR